MLIYPKGRRRLAKEQQVRDLSQLPDSFFANLHTTRPALGSFILQISGEIVTPNDPDYEKDRQESNPAFQEFPYVIAYCECWDDVYQCLKWAQTLNVGFVCRSGGHSTAGYSVMNNGLVIDISRLDYVAVNPQAQQVVVEAGCTFDKFNKALNAAQVHVPGGICPDVCVAGYMMGGGYGFTSREFGMNCDNVLAVDVMLWNGAVVAASPTVNPDLFWAIRGGTGGNFGLLLAVTYRTVPLWQVWGVGLAWQMAQAPAVLVELQKDYMRTGASPKLGYMIAIGRNEDATGAGTIQFRGMFDGSRADGMQQLQPLLAVGNPRIQYDQTGTYYDIHDALVEGGTQPVPGPPDGAKEVKQGGYIAKPLTEADWARVITYHTTQAELPWGLTSIEPYGGAINAYPVDGNAFIHRNVDMNFFVDAFWMDPKDQGKATAWLDGFMALMQPYFNGESYQNYPRRGMADYRRQFWGQAFPSLLAVKQKYDPFNVFNFPQGISPYPTGEAPPAGATLGASSVDTKAPITYLIPPRITRKA